MLVMEHDNNVDEEEEEELEEVEEDVASPLVPEGFICRWDIMACNRSRSLDN